MHKRRSRIQLNKLFKLKQMKALLKNNRLLAMYALWALFHTVLLLSSSPYTNWKYKFWPFTEDKWSETYDLSEWLVYVVGPLILLYIYFSFTAKKSTN